MVDVAVDAGPVELVAIAVAFAFAVLYLCLYWRLHWFSRVLLLMN